VAPYTPLLFTASAPQLEWADLLVICAGILLAAALFLLATGWGRHRSRRERLRTLLLLAASAATLLAAHYLYDVYADALIIAYIKSSGVNLAGLTITSFSALGREGAAPQLMWADILVICAVLLLALFLFVLAVSWERHWVWWLRLSALVSLAASVAADVAAQHLYDTYASWAGFLSWGLGGSHPPGYYVRIFNAITSANNQATVLGWAGVIATVILLTMTLVSWWRLDGLGTSRQSR
jgi:hypothetical protein